MTANFLTALAHLLPIFAVVAVMVAAAALTLPPTGRWADRRVARMVDAALADDDFCGPAFLPPIDATDAEIDDWGRRFLGLPDPFETTLAQIRALPEREIA